jgi:hypothetical protein
MVLRMFNQKRGQQIMVGIMVGLLIIIALVQLITPLKTTIVQARTDLDCTNTSISTGTKAACVLSDWAMPYYLGAGLAAAIAFISMKRYVQIQQ